MKEKLKRKWFCWHELAAVRRFLSQQADFRSEMLASRKIPSVDRDAIAGGVEYLRQRVAEIDKGLKWFDDLIDDLSDASWTFTQDIALEHGDVSAMTNAEFRHLIDTSGPERAGLFREDQKALESGNFERLI